MDNASNSLVFSVTYYLHYVHKKTTDKHTIPQIMNVVMGSTKMIVLHPTREGWLMFLYSQSSK